MPHTCNTIPDHSVRALPPRGTFAFWHQRTSLGAHDQYPLLETAALHVRQREMLERQRWRKMAWMIETSISNDQIATTFLRLREQAILLTIREDNR